LPERSVTRLLLVRHGESMATVDQVVGGEKGCRGLSELGHRQSVRLRDRFAAGAEPAVDAVIASTLPRAVQTAVPVAEALGLPLTTRDDLVEHRPGDADGLPWSEVAPRFGPYDPIRDRHARMAPGAETMAEFALRVGAAIARVVDEHLGRTAVVSCHGGVIDQALRDLLGWGHVSTFDLWTVNASITEVLARHPDGERPARWRLVRYNDAAHLDHLVTAQPPVS
jgi:2,3-bisphosphoglycerate-dependent phosphoglycerate mutase